MKNSTLTKASLIMLFALFGFVNRIQAQTIDTAYSNPAAFTAFGGDVINNYGSLSFSGGEVAVEYDYAPAITVVNMTRSFTEGVQQVYDSRDDERNNIPTLDVNMNVYPNPTVGNVVISCNQMTEPLSFTLFSANGQVIMQGTYTDGEEVIQMENFPTGTYMLQVTNPSKSKMNIYKIIKAK